MVRRVDQILASDPFVLDESACFLASQELKKYAPNIHGMNSNSNSAKVFALFKLFFISICHQMNWDFLLERMQIKFYSDDPLEMLSRAANCSSADIEDLLSGYARQERIKGKERAKILREVAGVFQNEYAGNIDLLFFPSAIEGEDGLISRLLKFPAFSEDPVRKKVNIYIQELLREKIVEFSDELIVKPAVDYHLIRLYLRTGRVIAKDAVITDLLASTSPTRMRVITLLRLKVSDALSLTAFYAKKTVFEVNYIEWQIARQRCEYIDPICTGKWPDKKFDKAVIRIKVNSCPYSSWCMAHNDPEWMKLREPEVRRAFY